MSNIKKYGALLFIFPLVLLLNSCGSKKNTVSIGGRVVEKTQKELIDDILGSEIKFNTISAKTKFEFTNVNSQKSQKVTAVLKMKRDEAIQISFRALFGYEVAIITLTTDSIHIFDRYNKRYGSEDISKFASSNNTFNYHNLQALLTNSIFLPGESSVNEANYKKFDVGTSSNMYLLKAKDKSDILYNFAVDGNAKLASTLIFSPKKFTVQWSYLEFIQDGNYLYPTEMQANIETTNQRIDLNISYDKLEINADLEINMPKPNSKFKKIPVSEVIKQYIGL